jgi:hypothetical protein
VRWQGGFVVKARTSACLADDPLGLTAIARFRPPVVADNGPGTKLSLFERRSTTSFRLPEGEFDETFKTVETMTVGDSFGPIPNNVRIRFISVDPSPIRASTDFINIVGQIRGFFEIPNCTVTFNMSLVKRR